MSNITISGYRKMLNLTQADVAEKFGISRQAYYLKEKGKISFSDNEKLIFKQMLLPIFPDITIDLIFFS
ncbi:MAG: helix-turn-helix transcriptional regulator [Enterococcus sp.]